MVIAMCRDWHGGTSDNCMPQNTVLRRTERLVYHDELNKIIAGGKYGWPMVTGDDEQEGCIAPLAHSGEDTWAPGGLVWGK